MRQLSFCENTTKERQSIGLQTNGHFTVQCNSQSVCECYQLLSDEVRYKILCS